MEMYPNTTKIIAVATRVSTVLLLVAVMGLLPVNAMHGSVGRYTIAFNTPGTC
jgi:hypothetical protein